MTRAQEINSCDPIPGTPTDPKKVPREQIFCEKIIMDKDLEVKGKFDAKGLAALSAVSVQGHQFQVATITTPGPLEAVILTLADGTVTPIVAGMKILVALP